LKEIIIDLILGFYLTPLLFNTFVFLVVKLQNNNQLNKKYFILNLVPIYNFIITFVIGYFILKECGHQFFIKKEQHKYAIGLIILCLIMIVWGFVNSIIAGVIFTIIVIILFAIMIKG
jgi:hypothetical protein